MENIIIGSDKKTMILIPAGEFIMGSEEYGPETPIRKVSLKNYYIDKYPVTNGEYKKFVDDTGYKKPPLWNEKDYDAKKYENHPVQMVNWHDSSAYSSWAGKRLPTEAEWEKAARGTDGRRWPWGNEYIEANAATWESIGIKGFITTEVTAHPDGASPYGVCEMAGLVEEWVNDWLDAHPGSNYQSMSYGKKFKILKGGAWIFTQSHARCAYRCFEKPDVEGMNPKMGGPSFRCVLDVKN
jgi:formylglycine-generating enzyme